MLVILTTEEERDVCIWHEEHSSAPMMHCGLAHRGRKEDQPAAGRTGCKP
jgi:hypothetical protein